MPEIPTPVPTDQLDLVHALCDIESGLTQWEENFVESIARQTLEHGTHLSPKQRATAQKVLDRVLSQLTGEET